jgi:hypothetical protein
LAEVCTCKTFEPLTRQASGVRVRTCLRLRNLWRLSEPSRGSCSGSGREAAVYPIQKSVKIVNCYDMAVHGDAVYGLLDCFRYRRERNWPMISACLLLQLAEYRVTGNAERDYSVLRNSAMATPSSTRPIAATMARDRPRGTSQPSQVMPGLSVRSATGLTDRWSKTACRIGSTI